MSNNKEEFRRLRPTEDSDDGTSSTTSSQLSEDEEVGMLFEVQTKNNNGKGGGEGNWLKRQTCRLLALVFVFQVGMAIAAFVASSGAKDDSSSSLGSTYLMYVSEATGEVFNSMEHPMTLFSAFQQIPSAKGGMDDPDVVHGMSVQHRHATLYQFKEPNPLYGIQDRAFLARTLYKPSGGNTTLVVDDAVAMEGVEWLVQFKLPPFDPEAESFVDPDMQFLVHTDRGTDTRYMGKNAHLLLLTSRGEIQQGGFAAFEVQDHTWDWVNGTIYRWS